MNINSIYLIFNPSTNTFISCGNTAMEAWTRLFQIHKASNRKIKFSIAYYEEHGYKALEFKCDTKSRKVII